VAWAAWAVFGAVLVVLLVADLLLVHRRAHSVGLREAAVWSAVWLAAGLGFAVFLLLWRGGSDAEQYLAAYVIERGLSMDNVFVFAVLFAFFAVPEGYRHFVLVFGIGCALVFRLVFIATGTVALAHLSWAAYVLGVFLVLTGVRLAMRDVEPQPGRNPALAVLRRAVPMTDDYRGRTLLLRTKEGLRATPMLAVLIAVATTDVAFAVDSIPAALAVSTDPFLVFAANAFSVLGLVALYFLLAELLGRLRYLRPALASILVFVGVKMVAAPVLEISVGVSLGVVLAILAVASLASVVVARREPEPAVEERCTNRYEAPDERGRAARDRRGRALGVPRRRSRREAPARLEPAGAGGRAVDRRPRRA
jgi:tellurite resistance protein TerC